MDGPRKIIITGGCGDIGMALARVFLEDAESCVALCDLTSEADAENLLSSLGDARARVLYRTVDVTQARAVQAFVADVEKSFDGVDLCIANAGIVERGQLIDLDLAAWKRTLDINLTGSFLIAQASARSMVTRGLGGHILLMSSWTQSIPRANIGAYAVSKAGLKMLAKSLALELGPSCIRVNTIAPGFVNAGLTGQNLKADPSRRGPMEASIPLGRLISADELARAIRAFTSVDAAYVTGTTFVVDGGASLHFRK